MVIAFVRAPLSQVIGKTIPLELILEDEVLSEAFVQTRQSAYNCMQVVFEQLCEATQTQVHDWRIPPDCHCRPMRATERRLKRANGERVLYDIETRTAVIELPVKYLQDRPRICTQVPDRSSINSSWVHFALSLGYM